MTNYCRCVGHTHSCGIQAPTYIQGTQNLYPSPDVVYVGQGGPRGAQGTQGVQGPIGPDKPFAYHHVQNSSSASWTIEHNLNFYPNITTIDSSGSIVEGEIEHLSRNTLRVTFVSAFSGEAFLS